jgi:hypothetical protein
MIQPELMTTRDVAAYLRIKERKVYELISARRIPCSPGWEVALSQGAH